MTDACNCDADPGHAVQVPCPVHDHPDMKRLAEERNLDRETALTMRRERDEAVARATRAGEYAARVTANYRRECEEVVRLVGVIARRQESGHQWPAMPSNSFARIFPGPLGIDVPIVDGDTVEHLAKRIASAMVQHERGRAMNPDNTTDAVTHITRRSATSTLRSLCGAVTRSRPGWSITVEGASDPNVWQSIRTVPRNALCVVCCQRAKEKGLP